MSPWIIIAIVAAGVGVLGLFYGVFVPKLIKMNQHQKQQKHEHKIENKKLDFEIEKQRANDMPSFCRYCGAKHKAGDKTCHACGAAL